MSKLTVQLIEQTLIKEVVEQISKSSWVTPSLILCNPDSELSVLHDSLVDESGGLNPDHDRIQQQIHHYINELCRQLQCSDGTEIEANEVLVELEWLLEDGIQGDLNYFRDQCSGFCAALTSIIVKGAVESSLPELTFLDIRDLIITDDHYGASIPDEMRTVNRLKEWIETMPDNYLGVSQNTLGSTTDNNTSVLHSDWQVLDTMEKLTPSLVRRIK